MSDKIKSAIVNAADKDFNAFKANVGELLSDKLETLLSTIVKAKQKSIFKTGEK